MKEKKKSVQEIEKGRRIRGLAWIRKDRPKGKRRDRSFSLINPQDEVAKLSIRVIMILLSSVVYAFYFKAFLTPNGILPAGFAGTTRLIQEFGKEFFGLDIPYSLPYIGLNLPFALLCYKFVGKKFVGLSLLQVVATSFIIDLLPAMQVTDDLVLVVVISAALNGLAMGLALKANASAGGTDFIATYVSNKTGKPFWNEIFIFNLCQLLLAGLFFGWRPALYSIIFQFLSTQAINKVHERYKRFTLMFVTDSVEPYATDLMKLTQHGVTSVKGVGEYSGKERVLLYMVVSKSDMPMINKYLAEHGKGVFMNVMDSHDLTGRFYLKPLD